MAHKNLTLTLGKAVFPLDSPRGAPLLFARRVCVYIGLSTLDALIL